MFENKALRKHLNLRQRLGELTADLSSSDIITMIISTSLADSGPFITPKIEKTTL
jgi:hypothetical protein